MICKSDRYIYIFALKQKSRQSKRGKPLFYLC